MRWDNLTIDAEQHAQLPGYREAAVVRHFDAPEALDTRFYEVRAKSALNRVPERSRMPFRWTINPYRGCSHACVYCADGDTPILLADGRTRPLRDLRVGDRILGTERRGLYRRYAETEVLAHWSTVKPAYRVVLEDGTELVTSGDHRFLTERGWKHVTRAAAGEHRRPFLTTSNALLGTGRFARPPEESADYRRGYLCGVIRGDGTLASRRGGRQRAAATPVELEARSRVRRYLLEAGSDPNDAALALVAGEQRGAPMPLRARVERVGELIAWPRAASDDWRKGFLAGIFDAEGSCGAEAFCIANTDALLLDRVHGCLRRFGFDIARETTAKANGLSYLRLRGGLRERLRFFHTTDPAITRKRTITGTALKSDARTRVVSVEPLGAELPLYDITTGTGDFIADGVVSHNCFARPTHKYLDMDPGRDFEREIVVKVNVPEVLRAELARPSWTHEHVAMGTNTDPYQWVEGRYRLMPGIWEALRDAANPCSVLTKSPLVVRDLPLLREVAARTEVTANFSVPTLDEKAWRASEPRTPHPRARLEAVAELNAGGVPTGILVAPLMPGINDDPRQVERILSIAAEAGARSVGGIALHLRGEVRGIFFEWLRSYRPDLVEHYEELYRRGAYAPPEERRRLAGLLRRPTASGRRPPWRPPPDMRRPEDPGARDPAPEPGASERPESERAPRPGPTARGRPGGPSAGAGGRPAASGGPEARQEVLF
ncbi:MAG TPA: intein-containing Rv2578c family radical SAM protein [Solirubrobacteraceae bacterium]|nr:intein-containing Rv2578c family radical SAM protein [Solirubrobacteraceae bacterium]